MAKFVLTNSRLWVAQYDLSGDTNAIAVEHDAPEKRSTSFDSAGWEECIAGIEQFAWSAKGQAQMGAGLSDDALFAQISGSQVPGTIGPVNGDDGQTVYFGRLGTYKYAPGAEVGEIYAFDVEGKGSSRLVRGTILHPKTARTATGNGVARQVGAVSATQKLYAALHVFDVSGSSPTLDVKVQSDNGSGFGTPADQITFTQATAKSSQWATPVAGAITDDWWRITYTIGGSSPSFTFAVVIGIK